MKKIRVHSLLKCLPLAVAMVTLLPGFVHAHSPEGTTLNTKSPEVTTPETRNSGATGFNTGNTELSSPNPRLEVPAEAVERLRAIFERGEFGARTFSGVWIPGGSGYAVLETLPGDGGQALAAYEAESGRRTEWVTAEKIASLSPDGPAHIQSIFHFHPTAVMFCCPPEPATMRAHNTGCWSAHREASESDRRRKRQHCSRWPAYSVL
jgi:hypothetical protein